MQQKLTITKTLYGTILSLALLVSCRGAEHRKADEVPNASVKTFPVKNGWAYSIYLGKKEYIRQTCIPCISGDIPFETDSQALKAGRLVLSKLATHNSPTLTKKELEDNHLLPAGEVTTNNNQIQSGTSNASLSQ